MLLPVDRASKDSDILRREDDLDDDAPSDRNAQHAVNERQRAVSKAWPRTKLAAAALDATGSSATNPTARSDSSSSNAESSFNLPRSSDASILRRRHPIPSHERPSTEFSTF